jgi:ankyrin repeat protein
MPQAKRLPAKVLPAKAPAAKVLPPRPDLDHLKKQAKQRLKSLRARGGPATLAEAQLAIAREYGFASWPKLRAHVESIRASLLQSPSGRADSSNDAALASAIEEFLNAAVSNSTGERAQILHKADAVLAREPRIAGADLLTACVLGDARSAVRLLKTDPTSATKPAGPKQWPPILYLCFSRYLKARPTKERDFVKIARALLERGADPNSMFEHEGFNETALYGAAGIANRPKLTRVLLDAGADPDDRAGRNGAESLYHACEHPDNACLELLLQHHPRKENVSYCLNHKLDFEDLDGAKLMLDYGADPNFSGPSGRTALMHAILRGRSASMIELLIARGADVNATSTDGTTPLRLARRLGHRPLIKSLLRHGASDSPDLRERFLSACAAGNAKAAHDALSEDPALLSSLTPEDQQILPAAAASNHARAVRLMLDLGFDINAKGNWDGPTIQQAIYHGHLALVKHLITRGADLNQRNQFGGDALGTAVHIAMDETRSNNNEIIRIIAKAMRVTDLTRFIKFAMEQGNTDLAEFLTKLSAPETPARSRSKSAAWKPIMDAAFDAELPEMKRLLASGADPNIVSATGARLRPLHRAIEQKKLRKRGERHEEIVELLLDAGADPKLRGGFGQLTALQQAAMGEYRFVPLLLPYFEPLDLFHACAVADAQRVSELLRRDASLATTPDVNDLQPLHYCCASSAYRLGQAQSDALVQIATMLLKQGVDPMATHLFEGKWPIPVLYYCCGHQNNPALAEVLFRAGATPFDNETVYHASDEDHQECLELIERFSNPELLAMECTKCLSTQLHWGHSRGAAWLLAHGADPNALSDRFGDSALHAAIKRGSNDRIIRLLLSHEADPARKNAQGKTGIQLARSRPRILRLLK